MPADILGAEVLEEAEHGGGRAFRFIEGPIFCQLLMADEINRASPRTQSALLQAMQEKHVTIAGARRDLPPPFHVLATQNPIEQEGTYPLPEAQLDRFLLQIDVDYPTLEAEREILLATTGAEEAESAPVFTGDELMAAQRLLRRMPVGESVMEAILALVRSARPGEAVAFKVSSDGPDPVTVRLTRSISADPNLASLLGRMAERLMGEIPQSDRTVDQVRGGLRCIYGRAMVRTLSTRV
jgi:MoxR-like ATPase